MRYSLVRGALLGAGLLLTPAAGAFADDSGTALHALTQSAEQGDPAAQYQLGVAYANGDGVATDYSQAAHWFAEAAHNGNADARQQLAFMTQVGLVSPSSAAADPDSLYRVQVASVANEADGAREWRRLQRLHPDALGNLTMAVEEFDPPTGDKLFQVEGGPLDEDDARAVCGKLKAEGVGCRVVHPSP